MQIHAQSAWMEAAPCGISGSATVATPFHLVDSLLTFLLLSLSLSSLLDSEHWGLLTLLTILHQRVGRPPLN